MCVAFFFATIVTQKMPHFIFSSAVSFLLNVNFLSQLATCIQPSIHLLISGTCSVASYGQSCYHSLSLPLARTCSMSLLSDSGNKSLSCLASWTLFPLNWASTKRLKCFRVSNFSAHFQHKMPSECALSHPRCSFHQNTLYTGLPFFLGFSIL